MGRHLPRAAFLRGNPRHDGAGPVLIPGPGASPDHIHRQDPSGLGNRRLRTFEPAAAIPQGLFSQKTLDLFLKA